MSKKTLIVTVTTLLILTLAAGFILEGNCCKWENDCCCPNRTDEGLILDEFLCICSQGGAPLIMRQCFYVEVFEYPDPET